MLSENRLITVNPETGTLLGRPVGNTVGSLSEVQHSVVVGTLLGDGSMRCKTHALLEINHSAHQRGWFTL